MKRKLWKEGPGNFYSNNIPTSFWVILRAIFLWVAVRMEHQLCTIRTRAFTRRNQQSITRAYTASHHSDCAGITRDDENVNGNTESVRFTMHWEKHMSKNLKLTDVHVSFSCWTFLQDGFCSHKEIIVRDSIIAAKLYCCSVSVCDMCKINFSVT